LRRRSRERKPNNDTPDERLLQPCPACVGHAANQQMQVPKSLKLQAQINV
jgi:hypothetical protein